MGVWAIADGHAPPAFEPVEVPFHDIARWVPFRVVGLGVCAPGPGRNDGLDALPRPPGVSVIGPVRDQARPRRVRPGFHRIRAWVLSRCWSPDTRRCRGRPLQSARMWIWGAEAASAAAEGGVRLSFFGAYAALACAPDRAVQPHSGQVRVGQPVGHPARPDAPVARVSLAAIDRVPLPVLDRQLAQGGAHPCHPSQCFHEKTATRFLAHAYIKEHI